MPLVLAHLHRLYPYPMSVLGNVPNLLSSQQAPLSTMVSNPPIKPVLHRPHPHPILRVTLGLSSVAEAAQPYGQGNDSQDSMVMPMMAPTDRDDR